MRQLVKQAELDRARAQDKSARLKGTEGHSGAGEGGAPASQRQFFEGAEEKIRELEREQLHQTATQTLAEVTVAWFRPSFLCVVSTLLVL